MTRRGTCPSCEGLSKDGHLCRHCTRALQHALDEIPWLHLETRHAALGLARLANNTGGRSTTTPLPVNMNASDVSRRITDGIGHRNGITGWVRVTVDDLGAPWPEPTITAMCHHLVDQLPHLRKHEAITELVADVHDWTAAMVHAINRPRASRRPVGPCPLDHDDAPCTGTVYAYMPTDPSDDTVTPEAACSVCANTDVDPMVGVWDSTQWADLGRLITKRRRDAETQQRLAQEIGKTRTVANVRDAAAVEPRKAQVGTGAESDALRPAQGKVSRTHYGRSE